MIDSCFIQDAAQEVHGVMTRSCEGHVGGNATWMIAMTTVCCDQVRDYAREVRVSQDYSLLYR